MVEILLYQQLLLVNPMTKYFCLSIHLPIFFFPNKTEFMNIVVSVYFLLGTWTYIMCLQPSTIEISNV